MQDKKEHFTGLVKAIKNKVHDWKSRHLSLARWLGRIFMYAFLLLLVISVGAVIFAHFNLFHTDASSARYMLSALVQSQAAIVAIVITLTLIAVQLTASAYSPRVIDIFKKNPDMWILLGCYGVSIFYGFIVLKLVEGVEGEAVSQSVIWSLGQVSISLESYVSITYWLGAFTFIALFLYMRDVIRLLKPENIIERLAIRITKGKILNPKEDPIQPIMDIIHGSIMKYDLETTRVGLKEVTEQVIEIIKDLEQPSKTPKNDRKDYKGGDEKRNNSKYSSNIGKKISEHFCSHLIRVSRLAVSREDVESTTEVIKNLKNFCKSTAERELEGVTLQAAESLEEVGKAAAEKELENATEEAAEALGEVGKAAAEKGLEGATEEAVRSLEEVGKAAAEKELGGATWKAAESLEEVGKAAAEKELEDATEEAAGSLGEVGKAAAEKKIEGATWKAAWSLEKVGKAAAEKGLEDATEEAVWSLGRVGKADAEKGLKSVTLQVVKSLGEVGKAAAEKGLEEATEEAVGSLGEVGKADAEKGLKSVTLQVVKSLGEVGKAAAEKGLEQATRYVAWSLIEVGRTAEEKGHEDAKLQAAVSLAELTLLSGEIVKSAIQNYKPKFLQQARDAFKTFMELYEQELEKLRTEKRTP